MNPTTLSSLTFPIISAFSIFFSSVSYTHFLCTYVLLQRAASDYYYGKVFKWQEGITLHTQTFFMVGDGVLLNRSVNKSFILRIRMVNGSIYDEYDDDI